MENETPDEKAVREAAELVQQRARSNQVVSDWFDAPIKHRLSGRSSFDYWRTLAHWTLPQAAYLLFGKEPLPNDVGEYPPGERLSLAMEQYPLPELITPLEAVQWFARCYPMYDLPLELAGLLEESTSPTESTTDAGKREAVKAGVAWRRANPGESQGDMKTALANQLKIEIRGNWIAEIMRQTKDIPTNKGGRRKHP